MDHKPKGPALPDVRAAVKSGAAGWQGWQVHRRVFRSHAARRRRDRRSNSSRLPLVAALPYAVFGELPDAWIWIGTAVVCASILALLISGERPRSRVDTALPEQ